MSLNALFCVVVAGATAIDAADRFTIGSGAIFLDDVQCDGSESRLIMCRNAGLGRHDCLHGEDAAVICNSSVVTDTPCKCV